MLSPPAGKVWSSTLLALVHSRRCVLLALLCCCCFRGQRSRLRPVLAPPSHCQPPQQGLQAHDVLHGSCLDGPVLPSSAINVASWSSLVWSMFLQHHGLATFAATSHVRPVVAHPGLG